MRLTLVALALTLGLALLASVPPVARADDLDARVFSTAFYIPPGGKVVGLTCRPGWFSPYGDVPHDVPAGLSLIDMIGIRSGSSSPMGFVSRTAFAFGNSTNETISVAVRVLCVRFDPVARVDGRRARVRITSPRVQVARSVELLQGTQVVACPRGYIPFGYRAGGVLPSGRPRGSTGPRLNHPSANGYRLRAVRAIQGGFAVKLDRLEQFIRPEPSREPTFTALCNRRTLLGRACLRSGRGARARCRRVGMRFTAAVWSFSGVIQPSLFNQAELRCPRGWTAVSGGYRIDTEDPGRPVVPGLPGPPATEVFDPIRGVYVDFSNHSDHYEAVGGYAHCARQSGWRQVSN